MEKRKKSNREFEAEKLYLELVERSIVRKSEKVATKLLTASCIRAYEDTTERPMQKNAYKGKMFGFNSPLDMAIYFITELPREWEKWKVQTKVRQQAKGKRAKALVRPTMDRIDDLKGYVHGNLQMLSHEDNTAKARRKQMKPRVVLVSNRGSLGVAYYESGSATVKALGVSDGTMKRMAKRGYKVIDKATRADTGQVAITMPVEVLEPTNNEEEYKAQCELYGISYEPLEVREEREKKQVARILDGNYFEL